MQTGFQRENILNSAGPVKILRANCLSWVGAKSRLTFGYGEPCGDRSILQQLRCPLLRRVAPSAEEERNTIGICPSGRATLRAVFAYGNGEIAMFLPCSYLVTTRVIGKRKSGLPKTSETRFSSGGEGGIRTPGALAGTPDFESGAFNRTLPPLLKSMGLCRPQTRPVTNYSSSLHRREQQGDSVFTLGNSSRVAGRVGPSAAPVSYPLAERRARKNDCRSSRHWSCRTPSTMSTL